jgi:hypothetical protein
MWHNIFLAPFVFCPSSVETNWITALILPRLVLPSSFAIKDRYDFLMYMVGVPRSECMPCFPLFLPSLGIMDNLHFEHQLVGFEGVLKSQNQVCQ